MDMNYGQQERALPHVPLGPSDIRALDDILLGIIGYVRNAALTPQTVQRIYELEDIRGRLLLLRLGGDGDGAIVSTNDVRVIREAMITFVTATRRIVPQSSQRDETLNLVDALRRRLETALLS